MTCSRVFLAGLAIVLVAPFAVSQGQNRPTGPDSVVRMPMTPVNFDPQVATQIRFRYIGPVGNRVSSVAGVPGDPNVYYAGAATGGIWKTVDGGISWQPIFDKQMVSSVGALAVARSNASIVWAGTGEPWIRSHISVGDGVYKSTDAGATWQHMGLDSSGRIGRIVIDPSNPDRVFVAAQGHSYGPQHQRGVFRTTDGGATWQQVLFVDENTGAIDVAMDPSNPQKLLAATWQLSIHTWGRESGGPGSGIYSSTDGGSTWTKLQGNGLPTHDLGKISLAIAQSNPSRVYALIETGDGNPMHGRPEDNGELWRSDDGGATWKVVSYDRNLGCRQPYYTRTVVSTDNPDETYYMCANFSRSVTGGTTNVSAAQNIEAALRMKGDTAGPPLTAPGWDHHDMWIDPTNANRMAVASDCCVSISTSRGRNWLRVQLPIAQMYHVTVDNRVPYYVYGNKQDGPSYRGPSNNRTFGFGAGGITRADWHGVMGGESGWATPDPVDTNLIWSTASGSGSRGGIVVRFDERNRQGQNVEVYPLSTGGWPADSLKYRFIWDAPFLISPHDHNTVYTGSQYVHVSTNGGRSWRLMSPDLTRNDKSKQGISGGLTPDNIGVEYEGTLMSIAESPVRAGVLWTGSNDGIVSVSRDNGANWSRVSPPLPPEAAWGSARHVEPSRFDAAAAYVIVDGHQVGNFDPWVYRTRDYGKTWQLITNGIAHSMVSYAHIIREDPVRRGLLYLGTENSLYISYDDGDHWQRFNNNLPPAPVYGLVVQEHFNDLVVATYGRGFWILDDLSPIQRLTSAVVNSDVTLFAPRPAYRWRNTQANYSVSDDPTAGQNPPYGAAINYWVKTPPPAPSRVTLEILDSTNKVVRTFTDSAKAGLNRAYWDLRSDTLRTPRMRTKPINDEEFQLGRDSTRAAPGFGSVNVLMPPGRYTVRLTVNGKQYSQPLRMLKDPNSAGTLADVRTQFAALTDIQRDHRAAADMLDAIERARVKLQGLAADSAAPSDIRGDAKTLEQKFIEVETRIVDPRLTGRGQDEVRYPARLAGQLAYLASGIDDADFAPTAQQREVATVLDRQTRDTYAALQALISKDLAAYNARLRAKGLPTIDVQQPVF
jgi:photosystem II stability/assembly factor-like uncharacterized protein